MTKEIMSVMQDKMGKSVAVLKREFGSLRAGRATPQLLDRISVDYYGTDTPLNQVANIAIPEARVITLSPWESRMITPIEKAIQKSDLGINPSNDGKVIRLVLPELTQERRKELVKQVKKMAEETKVAVRSIRRDANEQVKSSARIPSSPRTTRSRPKTTSRRPRIRSSRKSTRSPPKRKRSS